MQKTERQRLFDLGQLVATNEFTSCRGRVFGRGPFFPMLQPKPGGYGRSPFSEL
jgi:hypothetical protein